MNLPKIFALFSMYQFHGKNSFEENKIFKFSHRRRLPYMMHFFIMFNYFFKFYMCGNWKQIPDALIP